jgi:hypothetical protein
MKKLKKLQKDLQAGKITAEEYQTKLQQLLDDEDIDQEEYDEAKDFEAEDDEDDPEDKLIYSQSDVDRIVKKKANQEIRKALRDAGVDLTGVGNKQISEKLLEMVKAGLDKGSTADEKELGDLRRKADLLDGLTASNKKLTMENAVLKAAGKYNPINPAQVVRALDDYKDLLEFDDEDGSLLPKSVEKALKRVAQAEPNLFNAADDDNDEGSGTDQQGGFKGKKPGGSGTGSGTSKDDKKYEANRKRALEYLGLDKKDN